MAEYIENEFNPCTVCNYKGCSNCILHELAMKFVGRPSTEVALVRHGRWIVVKVPNEWDKGQCSECKSIFNSSVWGTKYCPNCGAKMDGGK